MSAPMEGFMSATGPLSTLGRESARQWQREPLLFLHRLHVDPRFQPSALAALIERYPRTQYSIVQTGERNGGKRIWREGDFGRASGEQVIDAISQGRLWLNLRNTHEVDARMRDTMMRIFAEAQILDAPLYSHGHRMGVLISSPGAQVYYHADLPGQGLLQLQGRKRIYLYPPREPYLSDEGLENIALSQLEVGLRYDRAFDRAATIVDLEPGQGLFWPLNSPHRIENHDSLNVSVTLEYWTEEIRRRQIVNLANAILRHHYGRVPRSRSLSAPSFYAKAALQAFWRRSGKLDARRRATRPIEFQLDPAHPGTLVESLPARATDDASTSREPPHREKPGASS